MKNNNSYKIVFINTLITGFFGGIFIATIHLSLCYFNISKVSHKMILRLFSFGGNWLDRWYGYIFFILFIAFFSVVISLFYYFLFRKIKGWFFGAIFGIFLWGICGLFIPIFYFDLTFKNIIMSESNVASFCLLLLYGIFIGYSISYDYEITELDYKNDQANL